jgi:murein DD-endopeptidase MepM/ murein hydrolase activator NlpD
MIADCGLRRDSPQKSQNGQKRQKGVRLSGFVLFAPFVCFVVNLSAIGNTDVYATPQTSKVNPSRLLVKLEPEILVNGSPCLFMVRSVKTLKSLSGRWLGRRLYFDFDEANRTWYGLAGVGLDTTPGYYQLALEASLASGARISTSHSVTVVKAAHRTIALSVPRQFTEPDAETLARIDQERTLKSQVFKRISKDRLWNGRFVTPVDNIITEGFGTQRTFNGLHQSVHLGLDYRADIGTPVGAFNSGRVLLAYEMFYEGGFVVIDHGQGLLTLYMHLSEMMVRAGDLVRKGQMIGLSGATGRATGPHLHIGVRWQGIYVDPATMLQLELP